MPVLASFGGIVIRMLIDRTFGARLHAFYGDAELVVGVSPLRVIQSEVPPWVEEWVLDWAKHHQTEFLPSAGFDATLTTPIARQTAARRALRE